MEPNPPFTEYLHHASWGALAYDLLLLPADGDIQYILKSYGLTAHQLTELMANTEFKAIQAEAKAELDKLGDNAKFIARARALTESLLPTLYNRAIAQGTETKDVLAIFRTLAQLARLEPTDKETKASDGTGVIPPITLILQGVPGLEHLMGKPQIIEGTVIENG